MTPPQQMNAEVPRWVSVSVAVRPSADASGWGRAMVNVPAPVPPTAWLAVPANVSPWPGQPGAPGFSNTSPNIVWPGVPLA